MIVGLSASVTQILSKWILRTKHERDKFPKSNFLLLARNYPESKYSGVAYRAIEVDLKEAAPKYIDMDYLYDKELPLNTGTAKLLARYNPDTYFGECGGHPEGYYQSIVQLNKKKFDNEIRNIRQYIWKQYRGSYVSWSPIMEGIKEYVKSMRKSSGNPAFDDLMQYERMTSILITIKQHIVGIDLSYFVSLIDDEERRHHHYDIARELKRIPEIIAPMSTSFVLTKDSLKLPLYAGGRYLPEYQKYLDSMHNY